MKLKKLMNLFLLTLLFIFFSCDFEEKGTGVLELSFTSAAGRTILPAEIVPDSYAVMVTNGSEQKEFNTQDSTCSYELSSGTWEVDVKAKNDEDQIIAEGNISSVELISGETTSVSMVLEALIKGSGTIDVTVDWSGAGSFTIDSVSASLDDDSISLSTVSPTAQYYEAGIPSGNYSLQFTLQYGDSNQVNIINAVQVYDNLTSSTIIYLTDDDFDSVPSAPDNLTANALTSSHISLEWTDNSSNEEGFYIERRTDGTNFSEIDNINSPATTYSDTSGLSPETQYFYRVRAYNNTGYSGYSNTADATTPQASSGLHTDPPVETAKLIFIHHSCGANWMSEYSGTLGDTLGTNNYHVSDTYYNWDAPYNEEIGDNTDTTDWPTWFTDTTIQGNGEARRDNIMEAVYTWYEKYVSTAHYTQISDPGGENDIVMFKSCYPLSEVGGSIDDEKAIYNDILTYFETRTDKLFILVTPPGEEVVNSYENTQELCQWLVDEEDGWLADYPHNNVGVFDFYCVLSEENSHHTIENGEMVYVYAAEYDGTSPYHGIGDNYPNDEGNLKSTNEFIPLLNYYYNRWKGN